MTLLKKNLFSLLIGVVSLYMFISSFGFNEKARVAPLMVSGAILIMLIFQIGIDSLLLRKNLSTTSKESVNGSSNNAEHKEKEKKDEWPEVLLIFFMLIIFGLLLSFTTYLIAIPLFLCLFIWLIGKEQFSQSLSVAVGVTVFMYILFGLLLKSSL